MTPTPDDQGAIEERPSWAREIFESMREWDRIELERRASGWYEDFVQLLLEQRTADHVEKVLEETGWHDRDELLRQIDESAISALEEERRAEYALLQFLQKFVSDLPGFPPSRAGGWPSEAQGAETMLKEFVEARVAQEKIDTGLGRARGLMQRGQHVLALEALDSALSEDQESPATRTPEHERLELLLRLEQLRAGVLVDLGRLDEAEAAYAQVMHQAMQAGWEGVGWFDERQFHLDAMTMMAMVRRMRGHFEEAVAQSRRVLELCLGYWGMRCPAYLNNLGKCLLAAGRPQEALSCFKEAEEAAPDRWDWNTAFGIADAQRARGFLEEADELTAQALLRAVNDEDWVGVHHFATRVVGGAVSIDAEALSILTQTLPSVISLGWVLTDLRISRAIAIYHANLGRGKEARLTLAAALERNAGADDDFLEILRARSELARLEVREAEGRTRAQEQLDRVLTVVNGLIDRTPLDERKAELLGEWIDALGAQLGLLVDGQRTVEAFQVHEGAKSRATVARLAAAQFYPSGPVPRHLLEREERLRRIERSLQEGPEGGYRSDTYRLSRLRELRSELAAVEDEILPYDQHYVRRRRGDPVMPEEVQELLQANSKPTAAVSFFVEGDTTTAFVLQSTSSEIAIVRARVGRARLSEIVGMLRRRFNGDGPTGIYPPIRAKDPWSRNIAPFSELGAELLAFLPEIDDRVEHIVFAPHGPLHLLPLHALSMPGGEYLGQRYVISYTPSLSTLAHFLETRRDLSEKERVHAYVAGVGAEEDDNPELLERDEEIFLDVPWQVSVDSGPRDASRERVLAGIETADLVHLTCHGFFDPTNAFNTGLLLSDGAIRPSKYLQSQSRAHRLRFLVTTGDVLRRQLSGRMVVLRACSTGLQRELNGGDEFEGLSRSLLFSRASAVLVSLWNVDVDSSRQLLASFYRRWVTSSRDGGAAEALAEAQREMVAAGGPFSHPYHWAPFVLIGDWR